jgi:hypothetical protein
MVDNSLIQGLHQVAQKLITIGLPSLSNSDELIMVFSKVFKSTFGSVLFCEKAIKLMLTRAVIKRKFFIVFYFLSIKKVSN